MTMGFLSLVRCNATASNSLCITTVCREKEREREREKESGGHIDMERRRRIMYITILVFHISCFSLVSFVVPSLFCICVFRTTVDSFGLHP